MVNIQKKISTSSVMMVGQSIRRSCLHSYFPGSLIVSASTIPPSLSRFHHNRYEAGNGCRYGVSNSPGDMSSVSRLLLTKRFRGGSQHNFRKWHGKNGNHSHVRCENSREQDIDRKATLSHNNHIEKDTNNPLSSLIQSQRKISKLVRHGTGALFSLAGFLASSFVSFATDRRSFEDRFVEPIRALNHFLKTSGVDDELSKSLNRRLGINLCLLGRVHMYQASEEELNANIAALKKKKRRRASSSFEPTLLYDKSSSPSSSPSKIDYSLLEEARRYMKYATAVYGQAMINAAEVDARGRLDGKVGRVTKETISTHISVPAEDIVLMDVSNYEGDSNHLRHMVVIDHEHKKVVFSIRGTFSLEEIVLDVAAFSREFCGGEAHSELATMAERVWNVAGPKIQSVLKENPGYEFILTGHSLGAGAACLVTILVQNKRLLPKEQKIRCFAYASPPVYTPLEFVPKSVQSITNFVHENDVVPFLSIQKVRKLFSSLHAVDLYAHNQMSKKERYKVVLGASEPPKDLIASVLEAEGKRLVPKQGAPMLYIPAEQTVWLKKRLNNRKDSGSRYYFKSLNALEMAQREIRVYPDMLVDHFPARYEYVFDHIEKPDDEKM